MQTLVTGEIVGNIGIISLNQPEKRNALSPNLIEALISAFREYESNNELSAIVITGNGKSFSAGADLSYLNELQQFSLTDNFYDSVSISRLFTTVYESNKITIAALNGSAIAGGFGLALACDYIFAKPECKVGFTEVKLGFLPAIISFLVLKRVSEVKTRHLFLSGELLSSEEAVQAGLLDAVADDVLDFAIKTASTLSQNSMESIKQIKCLLRQSSQLSYKQMLQLSTTANALIRTSDDFKNGIQSFLQKKGDKDAK